MPSAAVSRRLRPVTYEIGEAEMPLPDTNELIHPTDTYPDRIRLNYQYQLPPMGLLQFRDHLTQNFGFQRIQNTGQVRAHVECAFLDTGLSVRISRPNASAPMNVYVDLNVLSYLHAQREDYENERAINGTLNWLHPDEISRDNCDIWGVAAQMVMAVEQSLFQLADRIARSLNQNGHAGLDGITVSLIEVAVDFAAADPGGLVRMLRPEFARRFRHTVANNYGGTAQGYEEIEGDRYQIAGFAGRGERYKLYEKTNRRVRLECELDRRALRRHQISRSITRGYASDFSDLFVLVAESVVPNFRQVLNLAHTLDPPSRCGIDLVAAICNRVRTTDRASEFLAHLVRHGRVTSNLNRQLINRLHTNGVLERVSRGIYSVTPTYRAALEALRNVDLNTLGSLGRVGA